MRLLTLKNDTRKEAIGVFVSNYFTNTLNLYGMTARGADWRDDNAQTLRFEQLLKILPAPSDNIDAFSLVDSQVWAHIVAARHSVAAALPGRFLPELGRSSERPFFWL